MSGKMNRTQWQTFSEFKTTPLPRFQSYHAGHAHSHALHMRIDSMQQIALRQMVYETLRTSQAHCCRCSCFRAVCRIY